MTDCVSLCQPELVCVRPRRPVRLRCCLCQTQERGAAGNAELVHTTGTLVLLVVLWRTLLEHSGAQSTRQHWRTPLCGSCLLECLCGWREFPPLGARSLSHHLIAATCHTERKCNFWAKMKIKKVHTKSHKRISLQKIKLDKYNLAST